MGGKIKRKGRNLIEWRKAREERRKTQMLEEKLIKELHERRAKEQAAKE